MMWPFKWKLSACPYTWCYLFFSILQNEICTWSKFSFGYIWQSKGQCGQFTLSLGKESPYIFNLVNKDSQLLRTFSMAASVSLLSGFDWQLNLRRSPLGNWVILIFSAGDKNLAPEKFKQRHIIFFFTLFKAYRYIWLSVVTPMTISHGSLRK